MQAKDNASLKRGIWIAGLAILVVTLGVFAFNNWRARQCRSQVVKLEVAAIEYQEQGKGMPSSLDLLVPKYVAAVPACPSGGKDSYVIAPADAGYVRCVHQSWHDRWLPSKLFR